MFAAFYANKPKQVTFTTAFPNTYASHLIPCTLIKPSLLACCKLRQAAAVRLHVPLYQPFISASLTAEVQVPRALRRSARLATEEVLEPRINQRNPAAEARLLVHQRRVQCGGG